MLYIDFLDRGVARFPDRVLIQDDHRALTYRQFADLVDDIASALMAAGVKPDSRIGIYSPNHTYGYAAEYGALRAGCIWVPLNYRLPGPGAAEMAAALDVEFLFFHSSLAGNVAAIQEACPGIAGMVCFDAASALGPALDVWIAGVARPARFPERSSHDTAAYLSTSGTTGRSKGIVHSNRAFATMVASFDIAVPQDEHPVHLIVAPLSHAAGIYGSCLLHHGATNVLLGDTDPGSILAAIERHKVTTLFLPPTIIYMMLGHKDLHKHDYSSLRSMLYGAAPMAEHKLREALAVFGPVMTQLFGQSEALMMIGFMSPAEHVEALADPAKAHRLFAVGREGPLVRIEIQREDGSLADVDERGEIVLRSDIVMEHYYNDPAATAEAQAGGWHHTGDIGRRDADGYVYIVDRKREIIISGGFNVFPGEIEQVLMSHEAVQDCAVVGVPDEKWGEAVMAAIELRPGMSVDGGVLMTLCKERLGSVKAPKSVIFVDKLPRSAVGKVLRREVRAPYWAGRNRAVG